MSGWLPDQMPALHGKTAVVTGSNSGLGYFTARELARKGAHVVLACRSREKTEVALRDLADDVPGGKFEYLPLDLADLADIRAFADAFKAKHSRLDILCNNAGVMALPFRKTADGFEMQMGTNHLGHFALTGLLFDLIKRTQGSRIVNVASLAHRWTRGLNLADLNFEKAQYRKWDAYSKSKLANLLFTFELNRRLKKAGIDVTAVAAHPGYSATNLGFVGADMQNSAVARLAVGASNLAFAQSADRGALPQLFAATAAEVQGGDYIGPDGWQQLRGHPRKVGSRRLARDPETAGKLWDLSQKLTSVSFLSH